MLFKAATIKLHFCWHWWSLWTKVVWVQIQPEKLKSAYLGHKDTSILNYNWCIKKLKTPMKQFERHIGMNCIEARLWFSVMQPSVPSTRRQTSSEISWSRSRWPVSDPMMFRSSCSLWSPASLKQHQQTRYTKIIIWEPFLFEDVCWGDEKKVKHQTLFEVCYLRENDEWNTEIQPGFDF